MEKNFYSEVISDVARTLTAIPPTQVSFLRFFSALKKKVKLGLKVSMRKDLAESVLFPRTIY